jgi:hypothetical protein
MPGGNLGTAYAEAPEAELVNDLSCRVAKIRAVLEG